MASKNGGSHCGDRARQATARRERAEKELGRAATATWLTLRLMGRASSAVEFGKEACRAPSPGRGRGQFAPQGRHVCTGSRRAHERNGRRLKGAIAAEGARFR